jgi:hypothetical protein
VSAKEQPFRSVRIWPAYGSREAVLVWKLSPAFSGHGVLVYRAEQPDGDYLLLNADAEPLMGSSFTDTTLPLGSLITRVTYRLDVINADGDITEGGEYGLFEHLTPKDFIIARRMMYAEGRRLMKCGTDALLLNIWRDGYRREYDPITNVYVGDKSAATPRFGDPLATKLQLLVRSQVQKTNDDGSGTREEVTIQGRLPGYPHPSYGSMIVLPHSDDRYVIGEEVKPFEWKGIVPVGYEVTLSRISRNDQRYQIQVPVHRCGSFMRRPS